MKKFIFILVVLILSINIYAQRSKRRTSTVKWISLTVKGGYGNSILFNSDVSADENVSIDYLSPAYNMGGSLGITFGDNVGVFFEGLSSTFKQNYEINTGTNVYTKTQEFKSMDIAIALRYTSDYGFYVEAGPIFNALKKATETNTTTVSPRDNYIDNFTNNYTSLMFTMGFAAFRGDRISVNLGLRGTYAFSDLVENSDFYVLNDGVYHGASTAAATNPFSAKVMLEVKYFFAFWGDATCGRGRIMFFQ